MSVTCGVRAAITSIFTQGTRRDLTAGLRPHNFSQSCAGCIMTLWPATDLRTKVVPHDHNVAEKPQSAVLGSCRNLKLPSTRRDPRVGAAAGANEPTAPPGTRTHSTRRGRRRRLGLDECAPPCVPVPANQLTASLPECIPSLRRA